MIFFIHIAKTGGSTFRQMLRVRYPGFMAFSHVKPEVAARKLDEHILRGGDLPHAAGGHVRYGIHRHLRVPVDYVTILRDPVDRIASYYHYLRYVRKQPEPLAAGTEFEEWIEKVALQKPHILNEQSKMIGGTANLSHFQCVGVTERFEAFCHDVLGRVPPVSSRNTFQGSGPTAWRARFTPRVVQRIEELNARDMRLYERARGLAS